ncbi:UrcA family protein [Phenylobacterium sp.]|uniref:UrcA family protein n=1 Tax=Phenylobacterium sp. TaxID=1871053 RepID=UPI0035B38CF8
MFRNEISKGLTLATVAAIATFAGAAATSAAEIEAMTKRVSYADLDLTQSAGVAALQGRVNAAVVAVCQEYGVMPLQDRLTQRGCRMRAIDDASKQVRRAIASAEQRQRTHLAAR